MGKDHSIRIPLVYFSKVCASRRNVGFSVFWLKATFVIDNHFVVEQNPYKPTEKIKCDCCAVSKHNKNIHDVLEMSLQ